MPSSILLLQISGSPASGELPCDSTLLPHYLGCSVVLGTHPHSGSGIRLFSTVWDSGLLRLPWPKGEKVLVHKSLWCLA